MPAKTNYISASGVKYNRVRATVGMNKDGKPIRRAFYGRTQAEAHAARDEYMEGIKRGLGADYDKITFGDAFDEWFNTQRINKWSPASYVRYETDYRLRILPSSLVHMRLADVSAGAIQKIYNKLSDEGCSPTIVRNVHKLLRAFFLHCVAREQLVRSPLVRDAVTLPQKRELNNEKEYLTHDDIKILVAEARTNPDARIFVFLLFTGLRIGECLSLLHEDINLDGADVSITKSVGYVTVAGKFQPVVSSTKTKTSVREVPMPAELVDLMRLHVLDERKKYPISEKGIFFASETGTYRDSRAVRRSWYRLCKKLNILPCKLHGLRHTYCTMMAELGVNLKTASTLMGHKNIQITAEIYAHVQRGEKKRAAVLLV